MCRTHARLGLLGLNVVALPLLTLLARGQQPAREDVPAKATVDGNYSELLRKIEVPQDRQMYGEFADTGYFPSLPSYAGHQNLPAGYWVYVAPHWYIWKNSKRPRPVLPPSFAIAALEDPFHTLVDKDVSVRIDSRETISGRLAENRITFVLIVDRKGTKRHWINKSHISYIEWDEPDGARAQQAGVALKAGEEEP